MDTELKELALNYINDDTDELSVLAEKYIDVIADVLLSENGDLCTNLVAITLSLASILSRREGEFISPTQVASALQEAVTVFDKNVDEILNSFDGGDGECLVKENIQ